MAKMTSYPKRFFNAHLCEVDQEVSEIIKLELGRQQNCVELIASENIVSRAVLEAQGSVLTNKYAEGYPGKRYYGGCEHVDAVEILAMERAKKLFKCNYVNVQPHSGSQANQTVFLALLQPHDTILSLSLDCGGHLTHGSKVNMSGKWFEAIHYNLHKEDDLIDYDNVMELAQQHHPKIIIAGCSAYPQQIDFTKFRAIADATGAYLMVDMAHFAGLVATGMFNDPIPHAHVVTTTTHKTLRGPRGGMILCNDELIASKINSALFPGLQGGALMHAIAAKAVAFHEALQPQYYEYIKSVVDNAQALAKTIQQRNYKLVSNGTASHLILIDLRPHKLHGNVAEKTLEQAGITCNKNSVPFDDAKPWITSGIRIGTPACTTRGFSTDEFTLIGNYIADVLDMLVDDHTYDDVSLNNIHRHILELCKQFPIYQ